MLKNLLLAVALVAVTGFLVVVLLLKYFEDQGPDHAPEVRHLVEPSRTPVLAGTDGSLEILVKRRLPARKSNEWVDVHLARRLDIDARSYSFLEVLVLNTGDTPLAVDIADLLLETASGERIRAVSLRDMVQATSEKLTLLAAHAPDPRRLLAPGLLRRGLVAIPRGLSLEQVTEGALGSTRLLPYVAGTADIDSYLERPKRVLLTSVLGEDALTWMKDGDNAERDR